MNRSQVVLYSSICRYAAKHVPKSCHLARKVAAVRIAAVTKVEWKLTYRARVAANRVAGGAGCIYGRYNIREIKVTRSTFQAYIA